MLVIFVKKVTLRLIIIFFAVLVLVSCTRINLFEKHASIPGHEWNSSYKPVFEFDITDTTAVYDVMLILRHNEKYRYNNIWLNLAIQPPGDTAQTIRVEKVIATNKDGWLGTAMDDIYDHRISLNDELAAHNVSFRKPGAYKFTITQIMREDPLLHVMNVGLRVEKKQ